MNIMPPKLKIGDEIRVIAPSRNMSILSENRITATKLRLEELGFKVSFSKHCMEKDDFNSSSIQSRIEDIHEAFSDRNVKGILTVIGGFNSNQLLRYLNYDLIKKNPKILCGFSDITALSNAIYAKTGLMTYSGPHFSMFGMKKGLDYTIEYFKKCLMESEPYEVLPSKEWSDDAWYKNQSKRKFIKNKGFDGLNLGEAQGTIIGGNLCTLNLLQGTEYMPSLKNSILFVEDDDESKPQHFDRDLQSLIHQPNFDKVKGLIIGRFQKDSNMSAELLLKILKTKKELNNIPIISQVDFGHTTPQITFPVGGTAKISVTKDGCKLEFLKH